MNPLTHLVTSDAALVRQALAERPEAFEALVLCQQRKDYAVARSLGVPSEAVDDVVQESLLRRM